MKASGRYQKILNNRFVFQNDHPIGTRSKPIIILAPQSMEEMVRKESSIREKGEGTVFRVDLKHLIPTECGG